MDRGVGRVTVGKPGHARRQWVFAFGGIGAFLLVMWLFGSDGDGAKGSGPAPVVPERAVSQSDVSPWPFTVAGGVLRCRAWAGGGAVTFQPSGMSGEYGLNGTAKAAGFPAPDTFWAVDPAAAPGSGLRVGLSGLISLGSALC